MSSFIPGLMDDEILRVMTQQEADKKEWFFEEIVAMFDGDVRRGEIFVCVTDLERAGYILARQTREPKIEGKAACCIYPVYRLTDAGRTKSAQAPLN